MEDNNSSTSNQNQNSSSTQKLYSFPIIYGNSAVALKKPENEHTHRWTIFVRGFNNEDISTYVRKVVFKLHESFVQPNRGKDKEEKNVISEIIILLFYSC